MNISKLNQREKQLIQIMRNSRASKDAIWLMLVLEEIGKFKVRIAYDVNEFHITDEQYDKYFNKVNQIKNKIREEIMSQIRE